MALKQPHTTEWFYTWFGTPYYDMLYGHRNELEAATLVHNLVSFLRPPPHAGILDAACGKGRHAILLAEAGFDVTGIDLSYNNIREARASTAENLSFFQHDMRKPFRINYFDIIFNFYTSFGYFDDPKDDINCLRSFAAGLKKDGKLVIDFLNIYHTLQHLVEDESRMINNTLFTISKSFADGFLHKRITVRDKGITRQYAEKVRALDQKAFEVYFQRSGLQLQHVFGNYSLEPFEKHTSERLILIASKR